MRCREKHEVTRNLGRMVDVSLGQHASTQAKTIQALAITALCIEIASLVTSTTTARSDSAVRVTLALAILGTIINVLAITLLEFRGQHSTSRLFRHVQKWVAGAGLLMPVIALLCLFVGTQPVVTIVTAGIVGMLMVFGVVMVLWFD